MIKRIYVGVGVVALAIAWYAFRPELLFINKTVIEEFPGGTAMASIEKGPMAINQGQFQDSGARNQRIGIDLSANGRQAHLAFDRF